LFELGIIKIAEGSLKQGNYETIKIKNHQVFDGGAVGRIFIIYQSGPRVQLVQREDIFMEVIHIIPFQQINVSIEEKFLYCPHKLSSHHI